MTYYLYADVSGQPDITTYELNTELFPGHTLVQTSEEPIRLPGNRYVDGQWVWDNKRPDYVVNRKIEYPTYGDQFDMLWHAMDDGVIPKIEPLYSQIKAVKDKHPKPE